MPETEMAAAEPVANTERGEVSIQLDGESFVMRPTFGAGMAIEKRSGWTLLQLARAADDGSLPLDKAGIVAAEMIRAYGEANGLTALRGVQADRLTDLIYRAGVAVTMPRIALVLLAAVTGGYVPGERDEDDDAGEQAAAGQASAVA